MAFITVNVTVRSNNIARTMANINRNVITAVDEAAAQLRTRASQTAPRDTGALRESIYVNNGTESDYAERVAVAEGLNKSMVAVAEVNPQYVIHPGYTPGADAHVAVVGVAANYGIFQELGTRHMRAQPFMLPSALGVEGDFQTAMRHVAD